MHLRARSHVRQKMVLIRSGEPRQRFVLAGHAHPLSLVASCHGMQLFVMGWHVVRYTARFLLRVAGLSRSPISAPWPSVVARCSQSTESAAHQSPGRAQRQAKLPLVFDHSKPHVDEKIECWHGQDTVSGQACFGLTGAAGAVRGESCAAPPHPDSC